MFSVQLFAILVMFLVSVLLSASVKRCFVSHMRNFWLKGQLTPWEHGLSQPQNSSPQLLKYFIWKETMNISAAPGGAAEPRWHCGGQLPSDRGLGQGRAAGKPGQAPSCWLPDMEQEGKRASVWALGRHTEGVERATTGTGCEVNKPVKSSLHYEKLNIWKSDCGFFNITQNNKYWYKKKIPTFFHNMVFTQKKVHSLSV